MHGILVPGGFGERGSEGKIQAARFARERKVPYFGICFGMQMAVIEAARNLRRHQRGAAPPSSARREEPGRRPDDRMDAGQRAGEARARRRPRRHHAARRLRRRARRAAARSPTSTARPRISERHRHRYEVNIRYRERLEEAGLRFSGLSPDGLLPEIVELPGPPVVHRRAVPPRAEVAALRAAPAVRQLHRAPRWSRAAWFERPQA